MKRTKDNATEPLSTDDIDPTEKAKIEEAIAAAKKLANQRKLMTAASLKIDEAYFAICAAQKALELDGDPPEGDAELKWKWERWHDGLASAHAAMIRGVATDREISQEWERSLKTIASWKTTEGNAFKRLLHAFVCSFAAVGDESPLGEAGLLGDQGGLCGGFCDQEGNCDCGGDDYCDAEEGRAA